MRTRDIIREAKRDGRDAGKNAASWAWEPGRMMQRQERESAERILRGIEDGDPAILDAYRLPNLSGEYAGDPTPSSLMEDYGVADDDPRREWLEDAVRTAWEDAASSAFWSSLARSCHESLKS